MKPAKIVVVGSINMDIAVSAPHIPAPGETVLGGNHFMNPGGKGANQAVAASRLGAQVEMIGCVGVDEFGKQLLIHFQQEKVGTNHIRIMPDVSTGVALITVSDSGENSIVVSPGANGKLTPSLVRHAEKAIEEADLMLIQLEIPLEAVEEAVRLANKHQVTVILNPAPAQKLPEHLLEKVDILTPNQIEGQLLSSNHPETSLSDVQIISSLLEMGVKKIVLTKGKDGVSYNEGDRVERQPSHRIQVVDTTAAGDSFNAGLGVSLLEGDSFVEAIEFAQKVAALTCTKMGAQSSLPYRKEIY